MHSKGGTDITFEHAVDQPISSVEQALAILAASKHSKKSKKEKKHKKQKKHSKHKHKHKN